MGPGFGVAPAFSTTTFGLISRSSRSATSGSIASPAMAWTRPPVARTSSEASPRESACTSAPARTSASAMPRPKPRLAPTTTALMPFMSVIFGLASRVYRCDVSGRPDPTSPPGVKPISLRETRPPDEKRPCEPRSTGRRPRPRGPTGTLVNGYRRVRSQEGCMRARRSWSRRSSRRFSPSFIASEIALSRSGRGSPPVRSSMSARAA